MLFPIGHQCTSICHQNIELAKHSSYDYYKYRASGKPIDKFGLAGESTTHSHIITSIRSNWAKQEETSIYRTLQEIASKQHTLCTHFIFFLTFHSHIWYVEQEDTAAPTEQSIEQTLSQRFEPTNARQKCRESNRRHARNTHYAVIRVVIGVLCLSLIVSLSLARSVVYVGFSTTCLAGSTPIQ